MLPFLITFHLRWIDFANSRLDFVCPVTICQWFAKLKIVGILPIYKVSRIRTLRWRGKLKKDFLPYVIVVLFYSNTMLLQMYWKMMIAMSKHNCVSRLFFDCFSLYYLLFFALPWKNIPFSSNSSLHFSLS